VRVSNSVVDVVGNTPMVRLNRLASHLEANIYCKLEYLNPGGSVKDRVAFQIIEDAERDGLLRPGGTVVEATSGNTGMGLALAAAVRGYKTVFVMPDKMSQEKIKALRAFGSKVVVTPTAVEPDDPRSYYCVSRRIAEETPGAFYANQYHNPSNPRAHYLTTGPEIWKQLDGNVHAFVAGMGTGGTISGTGKYLKEQNAGVQIVGVDPIGSILHDYFKTGEMIEAHTYKVEGFGEDFIPSATDFSVIDDIVQVTDAECFSWCRRVVREEGLYTGGSGGGAVAGAGEWAPRHDGPINIVVILPDSASRYLSKIFDDDWMREHGFLQDSPHAGRVADVLRAKSRQEVITARLGQPVRDVVAMMGRHGVSQLPVLDDDGRVVGLINESDVLNYVLAAGADPAKVIDDMCELSFALVEPGERVSALGALFAERGVILVMDGGKLCGILTKIDFIDFVSRSM
jgi:cystathionine beta-synthase